MTTPEPAIDPTIPRVLLFGHRGAGKSALIGALLQAGETQGETLRGEVVHSSVDLPRIRDAVYGGKPVEPSQRELVSYTIRLRPWRAGTKAVIEPLTVVLDDCDGKAAESLLEHPEPITQTEPDSPVAKAVVGADAIVLLVDAASTDEEMQEAFAEFDTFLKVVNQAKTDARAVGGFPIFMVLTQCDRLARPGDTIPAWEARVNHRTEAAWKAFDDYLKDATPEDGEHSPYLAFGSVDLTVLAVAVRRPPLPDALGPANQPYQVAELFRDCFAEAKAHRSRAQASDTRLKWTIRLAVTAVAVLFTGLATVALFPPQPTAPDLAVKVSDYRARDPSAAVRLSEGEIDRNKQTLLRFKSDFAYPDLDEDLRQFVESRLKEIEDYEEYRKKLANVPPPASARSMIELGQIHKTLDLALALPQKYAWGETAAAELRQKWLVDVTAIESAQKTMGDRYRKYDKEATALTLRPRFDSAWLADFATLITEADQPPLLNTFLDTSYSVNQPGGERVTLRVPYEFDEVYQARRYWEQTRNRVGDLRDLSDALGMTAAPNRPEPVLVLPEPNGIDSAALPGQRLAALRRLYPRQSEGYPEWTAGSFPDPARTELTTRLQKSFATGTRHVHKLLKVQDTKEDWKRVSATLAEPALREWGKLLHFLARLQDPAAPDPVAELAQFVANLDTRKFALDLRGFELTIPLDLTAGLERIEPVGPLSVIVARGQEPVKTLRFSVGKGERRDNATVYRLTPETDGKLSYTAGDDFRLELPVKAGTVDLKLLWDVGASNTFRFDRLGREPRLAKANGSSDPATGLKLTPTTGSVIPKFPVLMPSK